LRTRGAGYDVVEHAVQARNNPHFVRGVRALLPEALRELLDKRKEAKKEMEEAFQAGDFALVAILDAKQGAIKISANSVYGFCGADGQSTKAEKKVRQAREAGQAEKPAMAGPLPLVAIASAVTTKGRFMIRSTRAVFVADGHDVIYGDTDSVMVDLLQAHEHEYGDMTDAETVRAEDLRQLYRLIAICVEYAARISATFTKPNVLNFEKIAPVFLLIAKKTYAAIVWHYKSLKAGDPEQAVIKGMDLKGVSCVRRDWCPFSRKLGEKMLGMVLKRRPLAEIVGSFQQHVDLMCDDKVPLSDYLLTKKLKAHYGTKPPIHMEVALKMAERDPELAPPVGTRIQYVVCNNGETEFSKQGEEFDYALKTGMKPDLNYYFDKQLLKPILRTLVTVHPDIENLLLQAADHRLRAKMSTKKDVFAHFVRPPTTTTTPPPTTTTTTGQQPPRVVSGRSQSESRAGLGEIRAVCPKPRQSADAPQKHPQQQQQQQQQSQKQQQQQNGRSGGNVSLRALFQHNRAVAVANAKRAVAATAPSARNNPPKLKTSNSDNHSTSNNNNNSNNSNANDNAASGANKAAAGNAPRKVGNAPGAPGTPVATQAQNRNGTNGARQNAGKPRFAVSAIASPADVHPFFVGF